MGLIENFNCEGLCQEEYCQEKYTYVFWFSINGFRFGALLCERHYNDLLNSIKRGEVLNGI